MKTKDFKLFELESGQQVLFERDWCPDDEVYQIVAVTHLESCRMQLKYGYNDDEALRDKMFEEMATQEGAQRFYDRAMELLNKES